MVNWSDQSYCSTIGQSAAGRSVSQSQAGIAMVSGQSANDRPPHTHILSLLPPPRTDTNYNSGPGHNILQLDNKSCYSAIYLISNIWICTEIVVMIGPGMETHNTAALQCAPADSIMHISAWCRATAQLYTPIIHQHTYYSVWSHLLSFSFLRCNNNTNVKTLYFSLSENS